MQHITERKTDNVQMHIGDIVQDNKYTGQENSIAQESDCTMECKLLCSVAAMSVATRSTGTQGEWRNPPDFPRDPQNTTADSANLNLATYSFSVLHHC